MRFTTIVTALYAVASIMATPLDHTNTGAIGTAIQGNVTAIVELINTADAADGVRITYASVDIDHPDKFAPPVTRLCSHFLQCAAALAPSLVACAVAATELGLNPAADASCAAAATNAGINVPSQCKDCL